MGSCTSAPAEPAPPPTEPDTTKSNKPQICKVLTLGDASVGKTSLIVRFVDGTFDSKTLLEESTKPKVKTVTVDGTSCVLHIFDTGGQEKFRSITASDYGKAHLVFIVFDVTVEESFSNAKKWVDTIEKFGRPRILVGAKSDLSSERTVTVEDIQEFSSSKGCSYIETSAQSGQNVEAMFTMGARQILEAIKSGSLVLDGED